VRYADAGHPLGDAKFIDEIKRVTGEILRKNKPGRDYRSYPVFTVFDACF